LSTPTSNINAPIQKIMVLEVHAIRQCLQKMRTVEIAAWLGKNAAGHIYLYISECGGNSDNNNKHRRTLAIDLKDSVWNMLPAPEEPLIPGTESVIPTPAPVMVQGVEATVARKDFRSLLQKIIHKIMSEQRLVLFTFAGEECVRVDGVQAPTFATDTNGVYVHGTAWVTHQTRTWSNGQPIPDAPTPIRVGSMESINPIRGVTPNNVGPYVVNVKLLMPATEHHMPCAVKIIAYRSGDNEEGHIRLIYRTETCMRMVIDCLDIAQIVGNPI